MKKPGSNAKPFKMTEICQIVSYGGGTNSTAMLIEMVNRKEKIDAVLFADTGGEKLFTYNYIKMFSEWLVLNSFPEITIVKSPSRTLEEDCLIRKSLPSIVFGFKTCSQRWKAAPQEKWLNNWETAKEIWNSGSKIVKCLGFDAGEPQRAKFYEDKKFINRYPLIEWDVDREECLKIIKDSGLSFPGKSACFFCPNSKPKEILDLPIELKNRAIEMERNANETTALGLGRSYKWEDLIRSDREQMDMFKCNTEMPCECYEGD